METFKDSLGNIHKKDKLCPNCGKLAFCIYAENNCSNCRPKPGEKNFSGNYTGTYLHNLIKNRKA